MKYDDERKLAKPLAQPKSALYKGGRKTNVHKEHGSSIKSVFQGGAGVNPLSVLLASEKKPSKKQPKTDPYMVRMAKLAEQKRNQAN